MSRLTKWRGRITVLFSVSLVFSSFLVFHTEFSPTAGRWFLIGLLVIVFSGVALMIVLMVEHWRSSFEERIHTLNQVLPTVMVPYVLLLSTLHSVESEAVLSAGLTSVGAILSLAFIRAAEIGLIALIVMTIGPFLRAICRPFRRR